MTTRPQWSDPITDDSIKSMLRGTAALAAMPDDLPFTPTNADVQPPKTDGPAPQDAPQQPQQDDTTQQQDVDGVRIADTRMARTFALAGNAIFTMVSKRTGKRFTFKLSRPKDNDNARPQQFGRVTRRPIFVSVLSGPLNTSDYAYLGQIWEDAEKLVYEVGRKSRVGRDAPSQQAALWLAKALNNPALLDQADIYHAGRCGRCGRTLTVPSSIESGIGPECASRMGEQ